MIELAEMGRKRIGHVANVKGKLRSKTSAERFPDLVLAKQANRNISSARIAARGR